MQVTEEYLKDNFLTAYFIDSERQNIEIQATSEDKKKVYTYIIPYDENRGEYKALMTMMNLDQLHETTYQKKKNERRLFEEEVIRIAQKDGLIMDSEKVDTKFYTQSIKLFFGDFNSETQKEDLFVCKLAAFELDMVKNCNDKELKSKIRKADNPLEVIETLIKIKKSSAT